jgi:hypothetical protein
MGPLGFFLRQVSTSGVKAVLPETAPKLEKGPGIGAQRLPTLTSQLASLVKRSPEDARLRGEYALLLERAGLAVTFATLFDRPTPLEGEAGMRNWVEMFGGHFLSRVPPERRADFFRQVEEELRPLLHRDGSWFADYRRLRIVAYRSGPN